MNCPYCGNPMENGYLQADRGAGFVKKYRWLMFDEYNGDVRLPYHFWKGTYVPAQFCEHCKKITISLEQEEKKK